MFAKQTIQSASLVVALATPVIALADPDPSPPAPAEATGTFEIGAGYDTDYGFGAVAKIAQPNLFHTGNALSLSSEISERRQRFDLAFVDPHVGGSDLSLGGDLFNETRMLRPGLWRTATGISTTAKVPLGKHWHAFVGYRIEEVTATSDVSARGVAAPPLSAGLVSALTTGIEYSTLDSQFLPRRGSSFGASLDYADPRLGSSIELARGTAWASTHQPLGPFTLHVGARATALTSPDPIPISERLFLEGSRDVRGYGLGGIGPATGGTFELVGRASLELPIYGGLSLEGFADAAQVSSFRGASAGFGVIWRSPIGPLHLDVAFPLGGGPAAFLFGIGSAW
jgi:outer membrane protein insertion porin family